MDHPVLAAEDDAVCPEAAAFWAKHWGRRVWLHMDDAFENAEAIAADLNETLDKTTARVPAYCWRFVFTYHVAADPSNPVLTAKRFRLFVRRFGPWSILAQQVVKVLLSRRSDVYRPASSMFLYGVEEAQALVIDGKKGCWVMRFSGTYPERIVVTAKCSKGLRLINVLIVNAGNSTGGWRIHNSPLLYESPLRIVQLHPDIIESKGLFNKEASTLFSRIFEQSLSTSWQLGPSPEMHGDRFAYLLHEMRLLKDENFFVHPDDLKQSQSVLSSSPSSSSASSSSSLSAAAAAAAAATAASRQEAHDWSAYNPAVVGGPNYRGMPVGEAQCNFSSLPHRPSRIHRFELYQDSDEVWRAPADKAALRRVWEEHLRRKETQADQEMRLKPRLLRARTIEYWSPDDESVMNVAAETGSNVNEDYNDNDDDGGGGSDGGNGGTGGGNSNGSGSGNSNGTATQGGGSGSRTNDRYERFRSYRQARVGQSKSKASSGTTVSSNSNGTTTTSTTATATTGNNCDDDDDDDDDDGVHGDDEGTASTFPQHLQPQREPCQEQDPEQEQEEEQESTTQDQAQPKASAGDVNDDGDDDNDDE